MQFGIESEDKQKPSADEKFGEVDFEMLKNDFPPFIKDPHELDLWRREFFGDVILRLEVC